MSNVEVERVKHPEKDISDSDPRYVYVKRIVESTYRSANVDHIREFLSAETTYQRIMEFLSSNETRIILFCETSPGHFTVSFTAPPSLLACKDPLNVLYLLKVSKAPVSTKHYVTDLLIGTLNHNVLESMSRMMDNIFVPLISCPVNQNAWPEMVAASVTENVQVLMSSLQITLGQTKGETCLPLPLGTTQRSAADDNIICSSNSDPTMDVNNATRVTHLKDQVHVLEGCLITWTKQIKNILKQDLEMISSSTNRAAQGPHHPGPSEEYRFWLSKARNLNSIFDQLQSENIRKVLHYLDLRKSTYNVPFAKLCKEVFIARAEANDNVLFLAPLLPWYFYMIYININIYGALHASKCSRYAGASVLGSRRWNGKRTLPRLSMCFVPSCTRFCSFGNGAASTIHHLD
jgi:dynein heavy chain